ncbi:MAG: hypothetical protein LBP94_03795, partial [Zoogloeaceae bacterium]|nr:hypothetical protein [Zoogloeaceae bacterium]
MTRLYKPAAVLLLLSGCAAGPDFVRPAAPEAQSVIAAPRPQTASADTFGGAAQTFVTGGLPRQW